MTDPGGTAVAGAGTDVGSAARRVAEVAAEHAADVDAHARFPVEALAEMRSRGLLGLFVPASHGGLDGSLADLTDVTGRLGAACLSTALVFGMHSQQVDVLVRHADGPTRDRLLRRVADGHLYLGSVTTETATGGHLLSGTTTLWTLPDGRRELERNAPIVTGAGHADGFLIKVRDSPDGPGAGAGGVAMVYADRDELTIETVGGWDTLGMRGAENLSVRLTGRLAADRLVVPPERFRGMVVDAMAPVAHLGWAAGWLGATRGVWAGLLRRLRRPGSGVDLTSPLTADRAARVRLHLETVAGYLRVVLDEITALRAAGVHPDSAATQIHVNSLKVLAGEHCLEAARLMVGLAGLDVGYRRDSPVPVERLLRDLTAAALTYSDTRLLNTNGALGVLDPGVELAGTPRRPD